MLTWDINSIYLYRSSDYIWPLELWYMGAYLGAKDIEVSGVNSWNVAHIFWLFFMYYYHKLWSLWAIPTYRSTDSMMHNLYIRIGTVIYIIIITLLWRIDNVCVGVYIGMHVCMHNYVIIITVPSWKRTHHRISAYPHFGLNFLLRSNVYMNMRPCVTALENTAQIACLWGLNFE